MKGSIPMTGIATIARSATTPEARRDLAEKYARRDVFTRMERNGWDPSKVRGVLDDYKADLAVIQARFWRETAS